MNLHAGKAYRARLGFAGLLGAVVLVVVGKAASGPEGQADATVSMPRAATPGATAGASRSSSAEGPDTAAAATIPAATPAPVAGSRAPGGSPGSASPSVGTRTVIGDVEDARYGPLQVELVITGNTITDVVTLQVPDAERRDVEINSQALPILRQEVLKAQSAAIDAVSGASYTSSGYAWSVQSAIDRAGL